jgi:cobalt-zinc-cadmium efflux system outer membrane protein
MIYRLLWSLVTVAMFTMGCATQTKMARSMPESSPTQHTSENRGGEKPAITLSETRPLGVRYPSLGYEELAVSSDPNTESAEPTGTLKLEQALAIALLHNPEITAFSYEVRASEARLLQAGVLPNPELEIEVGEYDRGGAGFDSAETAFVLGQLLELGGKRRWRTRVAEAEGELAGWDYESKRLDVLTETAKRFMTVIAAQRRFEFAESALELAEKTSRAVGERVKAGKEPPLQASRSAAEMEMARMDKLEAQNAFDVARKRLSAMWGAEQAKFEGVEGNLDFVLEEIPALTVLRARLSLNPDLARWDAELRLRQAILSSEKAARIPDLEASVGYLRFEENGTDALSFGVRAPLPLFDRNRGNIEAAQHSLFKAEAERAAVELAVASELTEMHATLAASHQRAKTLKTRVVPAMQEAFDAAHEGYRQGKFGFLDMLDAQRGLIEAKVSLVETLNDYQAALIDIQRITGESIDELRKVKQED